MSPNDICEMYKLHKSTINRIRNNKHIICEYVRKSSISPTKAKRLTKAIHPETKMAFYKRFLNERLQHMLSMIMYYNVRQLNFVNKDSSKQVFQEFIASRTSDFYQTGILKLLSLWEKCIQSEENYLD